LNTTTQEIIVDLVLPNGQSIGTSGIPVSYTADLVMTEMIDAYQLPRRRDGAVVEYELFWEQQGSVISKGQTLQEAGVQANNKLRLREVGIAAPPQFTPPPDNREDAPRMPERPASKDKEIFVTIEFMVDNYSKEPAQQSLFLDDTVASIINQLVKRLDLPLQDNGRPVIYELRSKALGIRLPNHITLRDVGVPNHDNIKLSANKPAG
jgi:hypothetical protein